MEAEAQQVEEKSRILIEFLASDIVQDLNPERRSSALWEQPWWTEIWEGPCWTEGEEDNSPRFESFGQLSQLQMATPIQSSAGEAGYGAE